MNDEVRGSATGVRTLSWVVGGTDTDNREKIMACRIGFIKRGIDMTEELKKCPFCGSEVVFMNLLTPIKMFYCKNYHGCGAIVSFNTPICNRFDKAKIDAWNRREGGQDEQN